MLLHENKEMQFRSGYIFTSGVARPLMAGGNGKDGYSVPDSRN